MLLKTLSNRWKILKTSKVIKIIKIKAGKFTSCLIDIIKVFRIMDFYKKWKSNKKYQNQ
jgi:hypothetical protein